MSSNERGAGKPNTSAFNRTLSCVSSRILKDENHRKVVQCIQVRERHGARRKARNSCEVSGTEALYLYIYRGPFCTGYNGQRVVDTTTEDKTKNDPTKQQHNANNDERNSQRTQSRLRTPEHNDKDHKCTGKAHDATRQRT